MTSAVAAVLFRPPMSEGFSRRETSAADTRNSSPRSAARHGAVAAAQAGEMDVDDDEEIEADIH